MNKQGINRRSFLATGAALAASAAPAVAAAAGPAATPNGFKKAVKWYMVRPLRGTVLEKFKLLKELGFDGVEMDSPGGPPAKEVLNARDKTGLLVPGLVDSVHWDAHLGHPDPKVRARGVEALKTALKEARVYGATTVLLVPAVVNKQVAYEDAYKRSQAEIKKVLPLARDLNVKIAIENVWNNFLLSPVEMARYLDEFESQHIGCHFDVGNIVVYGWPEHWIKTLGKRILKLDVKEFSRTKADKEGRWKGFNVPLLKGECDWPAVMKALREIKYVGWGAAEIPAGNKEYLAGVAKDMNTIFAYCGEIADMRVLRGHRGAVYALAYSPGGSLLASAGDDHVVRLWDLNTGAPRFFLRGHEAAVLALAYAPDGATIASGGHDRTTRLWDVRTTQLWDVTGEGEGTVLHQSEFSIVTVAFSPDGQRVAAGADRVGGYREGDQTLHVFGRASGSPWEHRWYRSRPPVWALAFAPDSCVLAVSQNNGTVSLWDQGTERERKLRHSVAVRALAFSPDGNYLATSPGTPVQVWDLETSTVQHRLGDIGKPIMALAYHPDGRSLITGCWGSTVRVWDTLTGQERARYDWQLGRIHAVAVAPDGMTAAAAGDSGDVLIWDLDC